MKISRRTILKSLAALVPASLIKKPAIGHWYIDETFYYIRLDTIKIRKEHRKVNQAQVETLKESIDEIGLQAPLLITLDNTLIDGLQRYFTLLQLGHKTAPCIFARRIN